VQPARPVAHPLPALLTAAALVAGCDAPRPHAALERARDHACACKDLACAEAAEAEMGTALAAHRDRNVGRAIAPAAAVIVADTRRCMTATWRDAQPATLFDAEIAPPRGPGPCDVYFPTAMTILTCDRAPLALRSRIANDVISLRTHWAIDGTPRLRELDLYGLCLAALSPTLGAEDCSSPE
jgi:hypothetical protein